MRKLLSIPAAFSVLIAIGSMNATSSNAAARGRINDDEELVFYTTTATLDSRGKTWQIPMHGRIYEPENRTAIRRAIAAALWKASGLQRDPVGDAVLNERMRYFLADNEGGKRITIHIGDQTFRLNKSDGDGYFSGDLQLNSEEVARLSSSGVLSFQTYPRSTARAAFLGEVLLTNPEGISVISDIDDTVKITEVRDKKKLIANTFLRPFRVVPDMAELYRQLAGTEVRFHFVSGSPWQLYEPLRQFFKSSGFPSASFHLKHVTFDDGALLNLAQDPYKFKVPVIRELFERYPARKFILIGDSGEKDPEVYSTIAQEFSDRVIAILIRNVSAEPATAARYTSVFAHVSPEKWRIFSEPSEIRNFVLGAISRAPAAFRAGAKPKK